MISLPGPVAAGAVTAALSDAALQMGALLLVVAALTRLMP
jgi:hypothetical protein